MTRHHALLLALVMQASSLHAGPSLNDAKLTGTTTVPDGSTLTITNGGTLAAEPGATVTGLATPADLPPPPRYAIFILPIGGDFTDFELKATQSNFGEHAPFTDLYFYYHSPDPARQSVSGQTGPKPTVYFVDSGWTDRRRYRKQSATQSIYAMRSTPSAIISGVMVVVPMDGTITPLNAGLVWSYQRIAPSGYENIWHPVRAEWSPVNPAP